MLAKTRPARKGAGTRQSDPNFVDSSKVINDALGDLREENKHGHPRPKKLIGTKRKREPSPDHDRWLKNIYDHVTEKTFAAQNSVESTPVAEQSIIYNGSQPVTLSFAIPTGLKGPFEVKLLPETITQLNLIANGPTLPLTPSISTTRDSSLAPYAPPPSSLMIKRPPTFELPLQKQRQKAAKKLENWIRIHGTPPAGFLDVPAEIRNTIYRMVFVTHRVIDFGRPDNCDRSAAFLRTSKQICQEGASILYSENRFAFSRNKNPRNPFWSTNNVEIGYLDLRHFLWMIGPVNRSFLRKVHITCEDGSRNVAHTLPNEDTRFTVDVNLLASFKEIAKGCMLQKLCLSCTGRRKVNVNDIKFIEALCGIEVDELIFNPNGYWSDKNIEQKALNALELEMVRETPLYPKKDDKPHKKNSITNYNHDNW
jgi:hypothetical protein